MKLSSTPELHLTYCTNVHAGETLEDLKRNIRRHVSPIKKKVLPDFPMGLGLRLSADNALKLTKSVEMEALLMLLQERQMYVYTINGFPYGAFHNTRVKENVYAPDWKSPRRMAYTKNLVKVLGSLLPPGVNGSISTVPISWKPWMTNEKTMEKTMALITENLGDMAVYLFEHEQQTGQYIHLGFEPEPTCFLETIEETINFFKDTVFLQCPPVVSGKFGFPVEHAEQIVRRYLGVCVDTCHVSMQFEDPVTMLQVLENEGILISKIQLSAALETAGDIQSLEALKAFSEPVYFHQVMGATEDGSYRQWNDIPDALEELMLEDTPMSRLRTHFHMPLYWEGDALLKTTRNSMYPAFWNRLKSGLCSHLEIETYTFNALPPALKPETLEDGISREFEWVLGHLGLPAPAG